MKSWRQILSWDTGPVYAPDNSDDDPIKKVRRVFVSDPDNPDTGEYSMALTSYRAMAAAIRSGEPCIVEFGPLDRAYTDDLQGQTIRVGPELIDL